MVATVIPNTDKASLGEIASQRKALTDRARAGRLRPNDVGGGTFTITNLGMFEVDSFQAIITPPQAAILAIGRIAERIVVSNGRSEIRNQFSATLSCDHRVVDGAKAAIFLKTLAATLTIYRSCCLESERLLELRAQPATYLSDLDRTFDFALLAETMPATRSYD